ncbi:glycosyl hydrolase family 28-related protein, partial [Benzoatithermus flavus]
MSVQGLLAFLETKILRKKVFDLEKESLKYLNIRYFGAKTEAEGSLDASFEIQMALDVAKSQGGGVVYVPEGTWLLANPVLIPSNVT